MPYQLSRRFACGCQDAMFDRHWICSKARYARVTLMRRVLLVMVVYVTGSPTKPADTAKCC